MNTMLDHDQINSFNNGLLEDKPISYWEQKLNIFKILYIIYLVITVLGFIYFFVEFFTIFNNMNDVISTNSQIEPDNMLDMMSNFYLVIGIMLLGGCLGLVLNIWQIVLGVMSYSNFNDKSIHKRYLIFVLGGIVCSVIITPLFVSLALPVIYHFEIKAAIRKAQSVL